MQMSIFGYPDTTYGRMLARGGGDPGAGSCRSAHSQLVVDPPVALAAPIAALALLFVGAFVVPTGIEDFYVGPNQITLELPYLLRSIAGTRQAYNLEGPSVEERDSQSPPRR